jgi:hypothetical protein
MAGRKNRGAQSQDWQPNPNGRHEDFQPGNSLALVHGAGSPARVNELATRLAAALLGAEGIPPYLADPSYGPAIISWARAEAKAKLVADYLEGMPVEDQMMPPKAGTTAPIEVLRKLESAALTHRARLGLDPLSRARLGRDVMSAKFDMAAIMAQISREDAGAR